MAHIELPEDIPGIRGLLNVNPAAAIPMNSQWALDQAERAEVELSTGELILDTWSQERPRLPAPDQVVSELRGSTVEMKVTSKRSLIFHGWITLSATMLGFAFGTGLGILLAVGIVHSRAMDMGVMPWAIASQTIPILAIAPMIIVVLSSLGVTGIIPKAIISAYLSFFPVVVGMVKGLRSPAAFDLDLMKTYSASRSQGKSSPGSILRAGATSECPTTFARGMSYSFTMRATRGTSASNCASLNSR